MEPLSVVAGLAISVACIALGWLAGALYHDDRDAFRSGAVVLAFAGGVAIIAVVLLLVFQVV